MFPSNIRFTKGDSVDRPVSIGHATNITKVERSMSYEKDENGIVKFGKDGPVQLTNFHAQIEKQTTYHDGAKTRTVLTITGSMSPREGEEKRRELPPIEVPAKEFATMTWISDRWGMEPIVFPAPSSERELRTAIQLFSKPVSVDVYTHTGWSKINGKDAYLTSSGALTATKMDRSITVRLTPELANYKLTEPCSEQGEEMDAVLLLADLAESGIGWILLLAAFRAAVGAADFAVHIAGRTGAFKSEAVSLFQSLFGEEMDARHLPGSWSSTANALEQQAYLTKNALFVIDDYVPYGTAWQVRALNKTADQLFRGQGNQAGRARLTETSSLQQTYYPRGIILSTGEDIPEGHSLRARAMILELVPGDISPDRLSRCQERRSMYPAAMSAWIQKIAKAGQSGFLGELKKQAAVIRDENREIGHTRTPSIVGDLLATAEVFATMFPKQRQAAIVKAARTRVLAIAAKQEEYLTVSDPTTAYIETIRSLLGSHIAHMRTKTGGIPRNAEELGWTKEDRGGEIPSYKAHGTKIGWVDWEAQEVYIDPNTTTLVKRHSGGRLAMSSNTLFKRLKEQGLLGRADETRQRNTCRVTCENATRQVLVFDVQTIFNDEE